MRELTIREIKSVAGAASLPDQLAIGAGVGSVSYAALGQAFGLSAGRAVSAAAFGGLAGTGVVLAWNGGQWIGEQINQNTPVQSWIANGIESVTGWLSSGSEGGGRGPRSAGACLMADY